MNIKTSVVCGALLSLGLSSQAQLSFSSSSSLTAWSGTPVYTSTANSGLSGATTAQGDPTITGSFGVLAETFTPTTSFTLGSFNILFSVAAADTYTINLYDLGAAGTVSVSSSSATYTPGTSLFSLNTIALSTTSEVQGMFTLSGADQVHLSANEEYALEIQTPAADGSNGLVWNRGSSVDPGGQMFTAADANGARNTLAMNGEAGGAPRTAALALYGVTATPEPSTLALLGLGGLACLSKLRRRKA